MSAREDGVRPAANRPATSTKVTRTYCRRDGWTCTSGNRCDEHRVSRDPARLGDILGGTR